MFGLVGPNGAGKTTTIECLEGLRSPTSGRVRVLGMDPCRQRRAVAERIGVQLQESALPPRLRVEEALRLLGSLYRCALPAEDLLNALSLVEQRRSSFAGLSGGQKRRLFIALALVKQPELVFLDELTSGLDPQARRSMWGLVSGIRDRGATVVLTTHYMEEAERLCDRVMIIDRGRIVALDTPVALIGTLDADTRMTFTIPVLGVVGLLGVAITTSSHREAGILRRFRATPMRPSLYIAADLTANLIMVLVGMTGMLAVASGVYRTQFEGRIVSVALAVVLSGTAMFAIGYLIAGIAPNARTAQVVGMVVSYPVLFLSGATIPLEMMPASVDVISDFLPLTYVVRLIRG